MKHSMLLRRTAAAAVAVAALPVLAAPAGAASRAVDDAQGDMWKVQEGGTNPTAAPGASLGDFLRTKYTHTDSRVIVTAKFVDLAPVGKRFTVWVEMRNQDHRKWFAGLQATPKNRAGEGFLMTNNGKDVTCDIRLRIDYDRNTVRAGFPRTCLDNPRWLQFSTLSEQVRRTWKYAWLDNAQTKAIDSRAWSTKVRHG